MRRDCEECWSLMLTLPPVTMSWSALGHAAWCRRFFFLLSAGPLPLQTEIARAVDEAGLLPCEGDASAPEFAVPIKQMNKAFEPGKPFEFSCEVALLSKDTDVDAASSEEEEGGDASEVATAAGAEAASEPEADAVTDVTPVADKAQEAST